MTHEQADAADPRIPRIVSESGTLGMIEAYGGPDTCPLSFLKGRDSELGVAVTQLLNMIDELNEAGSDTGIRIATEMCTPERDGFTGVRRTAYHGEEIIVDHATERSSGDTMDVPAARTLDWGRDSYLLEIGAREDACRRLASFLPV